CPSWFPLLVLVCAVCSFSFFFFFSSRRRHTRCYRDWSSDVCSSDLTARSSLGLLKCTERASRADEPTPAPIPPMADRLGPSRLCARARRLRAGPGGHLGIAARDARADRHAARDGAQGRPHPRGGPLQPRLAR